MNPSTAFGLAFGDELVRCGLREVVLAPGSRSTPLAMAFGALEQRGRLRLHVRIDERSASFAALGLAKASRRPVAVLCTSGTAAANFHPAVIEADPAPWRDRAAAAAAFLGAAPSWAPLAAESTGPRP